MRRKPLLQFVGLIIAAIPYTVSADEPNALSKAEKQAAASGFQVGSALLEHRDVELPLRVGVVEVDDFPAVQPVLNDRAFADDATAVPLANRCRRIV